MVYSSFSELNRETSHTFLTGLFHTIFKLGCGPFYVVSAEILIHVCSFFFFTATLLHYVVLSSVVVGRHTKIHAGNNSIVRSK